MSVLRLETIEKVFPGGHRAVAGVDLDVAEKELVVLLGPSGCGKSTLLRIVAGVETPDSGRVFIDGEDVTFLPPQKRDIAMVFQSYALYPHMKVRENLGFGLRMRGLARAAIDQRVDEVAEMLGLAPLLDRRPAQLSGGQRQRVALGRALARQPKVFLFDEPLSNLDAQLRLTTRAELSKLHQSLNAPILYVTHDQEEAMTLGDRVVVLAAGQIQQVGSPMEIYRRPETRFVGGFVGSPQMNFLSARLVPADGEMIVEGLGGAFRFVMTGDRVSANGSGTVLLGIRPEDIEVTSPEDGDLRGRTEVAERLGREVLLHVRIEGTEVEMPAEIRILLGERSDAVPGDRVGMRFRRDRLHLFDAATERRLR